MMDGADEKAMEEDTSLEGEDFLSCLTDEERECLQYLLETIDSLDQDEDENANGDHDTGEHLTNSTAGLQDRNTKLKSLSESVKLSEKAEAGHTPSRMKIVKSYSEDCPGFSITVSPDTGQRSTSSHPCHLRKFDTIMRSGVNVQELRARFVRQPGNSSLEETFKETSLSSKLLPQAARSHVSARQEALQKLGLLKVNQSNSDIGRNSPEDQHGMDQHPPRNNFELNQNDIKPGENIPQSVERKPVGFDKIWPT
ncbi:PREDICTED: uncharacterized protein LOC108804395 [Nanorana parkeri]|uniref:uncharacterized protein LOC108804395 n=1 Tax=Nanorana parkeri TaxID=125878 RepID=UPI0008548CB9|nr:PREDICTED: uncharacterized protein LOC108804395 [Nanorana parkeri]